MVCYKTEKDAISIPQSFLQKTLVEGFKMRLDIQSKAVKPEDLRTDDEKFRESKVLLKVLTDHSNWEAKVGLFDP